MTFSHHAFYIIILGLETLIFRPSDVAPEEQTREMPIMDKILLESYHSSFDDEKVESFLDGVVQQ